MEPSQSRKRPSARRVIRSLGLLGVAAGAAAGLLGFAGRLWWVLDLFSHFRVQYAAIGLLALLALAALKEWRWAAAGAVVFVFNAAPIAPLYWGAGSSVDLERPAIDLVVFNANFGNTNYSDVADYLAKSNADVVLVVEATEGMRDALRARLPGYSVVGETRTDAFGMLAFSKRTVVAHETLSLGAHAVPALALEIDKDGETFSLLGLHTMPPVGASNAAIRDAMMVRATEWAGNHDNAVILGDFNATPWSHSFRDMLEDGNLHNSQRGFGLQTTWPGGLWPMSIPIDHCVHSRQLSTIKRSVGPFLGSDHRPLHLSLGFERDSRHVSRRSPTH